MPLPTRLREKILQNGISGDTDCANCAAWWPLSPQHHSQTPQSCVQRQDSLQIHEMQQVLQVQDHTEAKAEQEKVPVLLRSCAQTKVCVLLPKEPQAPMVLRQHTLDCAENSLCTIHWQKVQQQVPLVEDAESRASSVQTPTATALAAMQQEELHQQAAIV